MKIQKLYVRDVTFPSIIHSKVGASTKTPLVKAWSNYRCFGTNDTSSNDNESSSNPTDIQSSNVHRPTMRGMQRPNRFTSIYSEMQQTCRDEIEAYAKCVMMAQQQQQQETTDKNIGTTYQMCAAEFAPVKDCFRTVRRQLRLGQERTR